MSTQIAKPGEQKTALKTPQELVHIKHKITLLQYKYWVLMVRAFRDAYERGESVDTDKEYCYLPMSQLGELLGYTPKTADIEKDLDAVRREPIVFNVLEKDGTKAKTGKGFISDWYVSSNRIGVIFPNVVRDAIKNLDEKTSLFHLLNWQAFNSFTGKYEAILYKLCKDYLAVGGPRPFSVDEFREYMGIKETEYPDFKRLNQWVISTPIKRINESDLSEITVRAEFTRERRRVVRIKFLVSAKAQTMMDFDEHPAFRFAKVSVESVQRREYLSLRSAEEVELCIERANEYGAKAEKSGGSVNYGGLYRKSITEGWHIQHAEKKKREEQKSEKRTAGVKEEAKRRDDAEAKLLDEKKERERLLAAFDALPDQEKNQIGVEATKNDKIAVAKFTKTRFESPIVRMAIARYLRENNLFSKS